MQEEPWDQQDIHAGHLGRHLPLRQGAEREPLISEGKFKDLGDADWAVSNDRVPDQCPTTHQPVPFTLA